MGDVILTTPIIRCLKLQLKAEVHFVVKPQFEDLVKENEHISKVHFLNSPIKELIQVLSKEKFDLVVDLQKNRKSRVLTQGLKPKSQISFDKLNLKKWLLVQTGINLLPKKHIVDRYFESMKEIGVTDDNKGCEIFLNSKSKEAISKYDLPVSYIVLAIGAAHVGKRMTLNQITSVISSSKHKVVLLGDKNDSLVVQQITPSEKYIDLTGKTSLIETASIISQSTLVVSGDTGLMHMAAAFDIPQVSVWGCTRPILGMYPYTSSSSIILSKESMRPCSKLGNSCKYHPHFCISEISSEKIEKSVKSILEK